MTEIMNNWPRDRKHRLPDDEDVYINKHGKRIRIDNLFEELSLTEPQKRQKPQTQTEEDITDVSFVPPADLNAYIADKMFKDYEIRHHNSTRLIKPYNSQVLVWVHFQKWVLRLFNRFIIKYNANNRTKVPVFKSFYKIITVLESNEYNLTYEDMMGIVMREGKLELDSVIVRLSKPKSVLEEIEEESFTYNDIKYTYWDTINDLGRDVEMEEA